MSKEIKEILENCEKAINEASGYNDTTDKIIDYITNLQKTNKNHSKKLIELGDKITNLQQENERKERLITQYGEGMCAYANRIDKAIECIKEYKEITGIQVGITANLIYNLEYILQGKDNE